MCRNSCACIFVAIMAFLYGCNLDSKVTRAESDVWSIPGANPRRTRRGPDLALKAKPYLIWNKKVLPNTSELIYRAIADEDTLFLQSHEVKGCEWDTFITAIRLSDGNVLWKRAVDEGAFAVQGKQLIYASRTCVLSLNSQSGRVVWHTKASWGARVCDLMTDNDRIYIVCVGSLEDEVIAIDRQNGKLAWRAAPFRGIRSVSYGDLAVAMHHGTILVAGRNEYVIALRSTDGEIVWRKKLPQAKLFGGLPISGGIVLTLNGKWVQSAQGYGFWHPHDYLVTFDFDSRRILWKKVLSRKYGDLNRRTQDKIATDGARIFIDRPLMGEIWCLHLCTGQRLWKSVLDKRTKRVSHPVISGRTILAVTGQGYLCGLSTEKGNVLWKVNLGKEFKTASDQILVTGMYVVVADQQTVWVLKPKKLSQNGFQTMKTDVVPPENPSKDEK